MTAELSWTLRIIALTVLGKGKLPLLLPKRLLGKNRQAGVVLCEDALGRRWSAIGSAGYVAALATLPPEKRPSIVTFKPYLLTHIIQGWPEDWSGMNFHRTRARRVISDKPKKPAAPGGYGRAGTSTAA